VNACGETAVGNLNTYPGRMKAKLDTHCTRFDVLTAAAAVRFQVFWHIMPYELVDVFTRQNFRIYLPA